MFNVETLLAKAKVERARREAMGISDSVEAAQPPTPPPFDSRLVGKRLEVCWPYKDKENGETVKIWASGTVPRVADGLTDKKSARAKKILSAGALLWAWEAEWLIPYIMRPPVSCGWYCFLRNGINTCSMPGVTTHASSRPKAAASQSRAVHTLLCNRC